MQEVNSYFAYTVCVHPSSWLLMSLPALQDVCIAHLPSLFYLNIFSFSVLYHFAVLLHKLQTNDVV